MMTEVLRTHAVGAARVTRIPELTAPMGAQDLILDWDAAVARRHLNGLVPDCVDAAAQTLTLSSHAWLVRTPRHTVLVDAGVGNGKPRALPMFDRLDTPFLDLLLAAGVAPGDVDHVLLTHLHVDHVGWLTREVDAAWRPTFPNARVILPERERASYARKLAEAGPETPDTRPYADSVVPVLDRADTVGPEGGAVLDGFRYLPTPGHSVGHMSIGLASGSAYGLFAGDVLHTPMQVRVPDWSSVFSEDRVLGERSRRWALDHAADTGALLFGTHVPAPSAGRVTRRGDGYDWTFA